MELLAFALAHPAMGSEAREPAAGELAELETQMPRAEFAAAAERGRAKLDTFAPAMRSPT